MGETLLAQPVSACRQIHAAEEEEEQLCMAKQLSLGSIPFDNGDNIIGDELLLNFGAKLKFAITKLPWQPFRTSQFKMATKF